MWPTSIENANESSSTDDTTAKVSPAKVVVIGQGNVAADVATAVTAVKAAVGHAVVRRHVRSHGDANRLTTSQFVAKQVQLKIPTVKIIQFL